MQRIPIVIHGPGVKAGATPGSPIRCVDILPTILREMQIKQTRRMDGRGYLLP